MYKIGYNLIISILSKNSVRNVLFLIWLSSLKKPKTLINFEIQKGLCQTFTKARAVIGGKAAKAGFWEIENGEGM